MSQRYPIPPDRNLPEYSKEQSDLLHEVIVYVCAGKQDWKDKFSPALTAKDMDLEDVGWFVALVLNMQERAC